MSTASLLVVTDVDSTLIRDEVIELLARAVGADAERHVAAVTERATSSTRRTSSSRVAKETTRRIRASPGATRRWRSA